jgi:hypothetical protein
MRPLRVANIVKAGLIFGSCYLIGYMTTIALYGAEQPKGDVVREDAQSEGWDCVSGHCQYKGTVAGTVLKSGRFELVDSSTPTVKSNSAFIWYEVEGTRQVLKVIFPDGTVKEIDSN